MKWWDWSDPAFTFAFITIVMAFLSFLATVAIPIGLWKLGKKGSEDTQKFLSNLEELVRSQRLSYIIDRLKKSRDSQEVTQLDKEVEDWPKEADKEVLVRLYWSNPVASLPKDLSDLSNAHIDCIMDSLLERCRIRGNCSEHGLESFIKRLQQKNFDVSYGSFAEVYTDPDSALCLDKRKGLQFYRDLVRSIPELSSYLIDYAGSPVLKDSQYGGFKANILTGVLLGSVENIANNNMKSDSPKGYKYTLLSSLANGMYGGGLFYGLGEWDNLITHVGYSDTITFLGVLIVDALGSVSDTSSGNERDEQIYIQGAMELLPSILEKVRRQAGKDNYLIWWKKEDARYVRRGVEAIKKNQPDLWQQYGEAIEIELDKVVGSSWRTADPSSLDC